jgi:hypothetical protein
MHSGKTLWLKTLLGFWTCVVGMNLLEQRFLVWQKTTIKSTLRPDMQSLRKAVKSDLALGVLYFFRWCLGMRMVMRPQSHPPAGSGTGGGPACVLVAAGVSLKALTAEGAVDTQYRTSRVHCQLPPVPAPSRFPPSSPAKCEISVKSKPNPAVGRGVRVPVKRGRKATKCRCPELLPLH